jgi:hypothetical protein
MSSREEVGNLVGIEGYLVIAAVPLTLIAFIIALFATGGTVRRRIAVIGKDGRIRSEWVTERHIKRANGHPWYEFMEFRYDWTGDWYEFEYRLVRSFGLRKYVGTQRIYLEGNPSPYRFKEDERMAVLAQTGKDMYIEAESDLPNRVMKPRRVDVILLLMIGVVGFFIGFALGGRV